MSDFNIRQLRKNMGLTQKQLAEKIGVSSNTIINWEKGEVIPKSKYPILNEFFKIEKPNISYIIKEENIHYLEDHKTKA